MEALALDVKCYEAFEQLVDGEMMTPEEGRVIHDQSQTPSNHSFRVAIREKLSVPRANTC